MNGLLAAAGLSLKDIDGVPMANIARGANDFDPPRLRGRPVRETPEFGRYASNIHRIFASPGILRFRDAVVEPARKRVGESLPGRLESGLCKGDCVHSRQDAESVKTDLCGYPPGRILREVFSADPFEAGLVVGIRLIGRDLDRYLQQRPGRLKDRPETFEHPVRTIFWKAMCAPERRPIRRAVSVRF